MPFRPCVERMADAGAGEAVAATREANSTATSPPPPPLPGLTAAAEESAGCVDGGETGVGAVQCEEWAQYLCGAASTSADGDGRGCQGAMDGCVRERASAASGADRDDNTDDDSVAWNEGQKLQRNDGDVHEWRWSSPSSRAHFYAGLNDEPHSGRYAAFAAATAHAIEHGHHHGIGDGGDNGSHDDTAHNVAIAGATRSSSPTSSSSSSCVAQQAPALERTMQFGIALREALGAHSSLPPEYHPHECSYLDERQRADAHAHDDAHEVVPCQVRVDDGSSSSVSASPSISSVGLRDDMLGGKDEDDEDGHDSQDDARQQSVSSVSVDELDDDDDDDAASAPWGASPRRRRRAQQQTSSLSSSPSPSPSPSKQRQQQQQQRLPPPPLAILPAASPPSVYSPTPSSPVSTPEDRDACALARRRAYERFAEKKRLRRVRLSLQDHFVRYQCRKRLADARPRVKGRFVKHEEMALYEKYGDAYRQHLDEL